jgi:SAM-dependent methyltransferase
MSKKIPPSIIALLVQFLAAGLAYFTIAVTGWDIGLLFAAVLCGVYAVSLSYFAGLAKWWLIIEFLFSPALVLTLVLELPPSLFFAAFMLSLLVYWSTFRSQVPLYLSSSKVWFTLEHILPATQADSSFTFIDLGSGLGGVLTHLAKVRPEGRYVGVELAPLPIFLSWLRIKSGGYRNCKVRWESLWDTDLSCYDVVFAYLSPVPMEELWLKASSEMRPNSVFISSTFGVANNPPHETVQIDDLHHSTLFIWHM